MWRVTATLAAVLFAQVPDWPIRPILVTVDGREHGRHLESITDLHDCQPEVFDPARFLPGAPAPDRFVYLPFGVGPRVCIGAQFALTEATLVLAKMIRAYDISRADSDGVAPIGIITTQPDRAPLFRLRPRH